MPPLLVGFEPVLCPLPLRCDTSLKKDLSGLSAILFSGLIFAPVLYTSTVHFFNSPKAFIAVPLAMLPAVPVSFDCARTGMAPPCLSLESLCSVDVNQCLNPYRHD